MKPTIYITRSDVMAKDGEEKFNLYMGYSVDYAEIIYTGNLDTCKELAIINVNIYNTLEGLPDAVLV